MQTFLPFASFADSASCLDNKRLGKQRVETLQITKALADPTYGWQNHPAVRMWKGHEWALFDYGILICHEWWKRGFQDTVMQKLNDLFKAHIHDWALRQAYPSWLKDERLHSSHRSNLLRKDRA